MENLKLKEELSPQFYDDLVKYGFIQDAAEMIYSPALINIDITDLKKFEKGKIVGTISQVFTNLEEDYKLNIVENEEPNACLMQISSNESLRLVDVDTLIDKLRTKFASLDNIIFGSSINDISNGHYKVRALLMKL